MLENWVFTHQKMELDSSPTPLAKINLKWIKHLNSRLEIVKLLENIGNSSVTLIGNDWFFGCDTKSASNVSNNEQVGNKLKSFCIMKEIINEIKRESIGLEKIFVNLSKRGLISKYIRYSYNSVAKNSS